MVGWRALVVVVGWCLGLSRLLSAWFNGGDVFVQGCAGRDSEDSPAEIST